MENKNIKTNKYYIFNNKLWYTSMKVYFKVIGRQTPPPSSLLS